MKMTPRIPPPRVQADEMRSAKIEKEIQFWIDAVEYDRNDPDRRVVIQKFWLSFWDDLVLSAITFSRKESRMQLLTRMRDMMQIYNSFYS